MFEGIAQYTSGKYQKGTHYAMLNDSFTNYDRKYRTALENWARDKNIDWVEDMEDELVIPFKTRVCDKYPPIDQVAVDVRLNLLCNTHPDVVDGGRFHDAYKLNVKEIAKELGLPMEY